MQNTSSFDSLLFMWRLTKSLTYLHCSSFNKPNSINLLPSSFSLTLFSLLLLISFQFISTFPKMQCPNPGRVSSSILVSNREKLSALLYISPANTSQKKNGFFYTSIIESIYIYTGISIVTLHILFWGSVSFFPFVICANPTLPTFGLWNSTVCFQTI